MTDEDKRIVNRHKCCPYCGHDEYYRITIVSGRTEYHYRYDGGDAQNYHIHDTLHYRDLKSAYCCKCRKKLPKIK